MIPSLSASFNKIFAATTPGYVIDEVQDEVRSTSGLNSAVSGLQITVRDLLINLCPAYEDFIVSDS
jgi:hypothetical protein